MKRTILFIISIFCVQLFAQNPITVKELREHISYLASDELQGRKAGTKFGKEAAQYVADQFKSYGLKMEDENGYQYFEIITSILSGPDNKLEINDEAYTAGDDFLPFGFSENTSAKANIVFVGYGFNIDDSTTKWHDYEDVDVKGKWVLILQGDPENNYHSNTYSLHNSERVKVTKAKDHGAVGVLFVKGPGYDSEDVLDKIRFDGEQNTSGIPVLQVKRKVANAILAGKNTTVGQLEKELNETLKPHSFELAATIFGQASTKAEKAQTQNVIALLPGKDPTLNDEYIVIGAHYDHLGLGGRGSGSRNPDTVAVHNGADDNASGTASLLEIAQYFATSANKPLRSILFVSFGAEEEGLLGSKYFVENPPVNRKKIRMMFNMDMVGRLKPDTKTLTIGGSGTAKGLEAFVKSQEKNLSFKISFSPEGFGPSDHASFYAKDIPVLFFFTGTHEDYHLPSDDIDKINFEAMKNIDVFISDLLLKQADASGNLVYTEAGPKEERGSARPFRVTLGVIPDYGTDIKGLKLDGVHSDGPAGKAGLKKGDIIVGMNGKEVTNIYDYMARLSELKHGQEINVEVMRDNVKKVFKVIL